MLQDTREHGWEKGSKASGETPAPARGGDAWDELRPRLRAAMARRLLTSGVAHRALLLARMGGEWATGGVSRVAEVPEWGRAAHSSGAVSGEELAAILGISRAAVHKHVAELRHLGLEIESLKGVGYCLRSAWDDLLAPEAVLPYLLVLQDPDMEPVVGLPYRYLNECGSTSELLKQSAAHVPSGTVLITDRQTAGRGRLERSWFSQEGKDLTFSVLLRPRLLPAQAPLLSLASALAVAEVLGELPGLQGLVKIKWPNDVLLAGKKVSGILLEGSLDTDRLQWAIVGVGMNVNSDPALFGRESGGEVGVEWRGKPEPVSLRAFLLRTIPRAPLLAALLARLGERCGPRGEGALASGAFLDEVRARDALVGRRVEVLAGDQAGASPGQPGTSPGHRGQAWGQTIVEGEVVGIGREGQLLVRRASGEVVSVFAGDVVVRPKA